MSEELKRSPSHAPNYVKHRYLKGGVDTPPESAQQHGINMQGYEYAHIQVVPSSGANPDIKVQFWSPKADQFVSEHSGSNFAGKGNGVAYEVTVPCHGREMFVLISGGIAGVEECWVYVSGFNPGQPDG